ncbi:sensor histidine kinase [Rhizosphaericola mali]|nr:histidine kinase [Rhizosphaericola mali]
MNQFPKAKLIRLSFTLSFAISLMMVFFFWASGKFQGIIIYRFVGAFIFFLLTNWVNIFLFQQTNKFNTSKIGKLLFLLISYIGTLLSWMTSWYVSRFLAHYVIHNSEIDKVTKFSIVALSVFCSDVVILLIQRLVISQYNESRKEIENLSLKANLADASNLLLRQQLQPHFLFNALATLKSLYKYNVGQGEEYLVHLASFLRESLLHKAAHTVLLEDELIFCNHYIKMQEIRFGAAMNYKVHISEKTAKTKHLPYFSLQPLIENAFKHNDFTEEKPLKIEIFEDEDYIVVRNNLKERRQVSESTGNGLSNLSERYKLLNEAPIQIITNDGRFDVRLKLLG